MAETAPLHIGYIRALNRSERSPEEQYALRLARAGDRNLLESSDYEQQKPCQELPNASLRSQCQHYARQGPAALREALLLQAAQRHPRYAELQQRWSHGLRAQDLVSIVTRMAPNMHASQAVLSEAIDALLDCPSLLAQRSVVHAKSWIITYICLQNMKTAHTQWVAEGNRPIHDVDMNKFHAELISALCDGRLSVRGEHLGGLQAAYDGDDNRIRLPSHLVRGMRGLSAKEVRNLSVSILHELFHAWEDHTKVSGRLVACEARAHIFGEKCALILYRDAELLEQDLGTELDQYGKVMAAEMTQRANSLRRMGLRTMASLLGADLTYSLRGTLGYTLIEKDVAAKELHSGERVDRTQMRSAYTARRLVDMSRAAVLRAFSGFSVPVAGQGAKSLEAHVRQQLRRVVSTPAQADAVVVQRRKILERANAANQDELGAMPLGRYFEAHAEALFARYVHGKPGDASAYLNDVYGPLIHDAVVQSFYQRIVVPNDGL